MPNQAEHSKVQNNHKPTMPYPTILLDILVTISRDKKTDATISLDLENDSIFKD